MALIYIYTLLYMMTYMRVLPYYMGFHPRFYGDDYIATRPLWTDLWRGRIWAWLMLWCALVVGGVAGILIRMDLGCSGDATVSPHGLSRPTPVVGLGKSYLMILLPICKCFTCIVLWFRALVVFGIALAQRFQRRFRLAQIVSKGKAIIHRLNWFYEMIYIMLNLIYIYIHI